MARSAAFTERVDRVLLPFARRWAIPALRIALGTLFVWFGALKVFDVSPVTDLVATTVSFLDPEWFVPTLGVVEVAVGIGLLLRVYLRLVIAVLLAQIIGTFLVFLVRPDVAFQDGNPLLLTTEGEFVLKNMVILASAMVVGSRIDEPDEVIEPGEPSAPGMRAPTVRGEGGGSQT